MLDFEPHIKSKIERTLDQWAKLSKSGPINVYPWCHWLGFDVICEYIWCEPVNWELITC